MLLGSLAITAIDLCRAETAGAILSDQSVASNASCDLLVVAQPILNCNIGGTK